MTLARHLGAVLACAAAATAQGRTWIIDASNGPGTNFTDLPAGEATASAGDTLLVRPGTYSRLVTGKGIAVLGTTGVTIRSTGGAAVPALDVSGVPAGVTFSLRRVNLVNASGSNFAATATTFRLASCAGRIHLEEIDTSGIVYPFVYGGADSITACADVSIAVWKPSGAESLSVSSSSVVLVAAPLGGLTAQRGIGASFLFAAPGLRCSGSEIWSVDCWMKGGDAFPGLLPPAPAISASASKLHLLGTAATPIQAGGADLSATPAIDAPGSTLEIDPQIPLTPNQAAPPIMNALSVTSWPLAALTVAGAGVGGILAPTVRSGPGDPYALTLALPVPPAATPLGTLFLDLAASVLLATGTQGASGATTLGYAIPNDAALRGRTFVLQAANAYVAGNRVGLSNPAHFTVQ